MVLWVQFLQSSARTSNGHLYYLTLGGGSTKELAKLVEQDNQKIIYDLSKRETYWVINVISASFPETDPGTAG